MRPDRGASDRFFSAIQVRCHCRLAAAAAHDPAYGSLASSRPMPTSRSSFVLQFFWPRVSTRSVACGLLAALASEDRLSMVAASTPRRNKHTRSSNAQGLLCLFFSKRLAITCRRLSQNGAPARIVARRRASNSFPLKLPVRFLGGVPISRFVFRIAIVKLNQQPTRHIDGQRMATAIFDDRRLNCIFVALCLHACRSKSMHRSARSISININRA